MRIRVVVIAALLVVALAGCSNKPDYRSYKLASEEFFVKTNHCAAAELLRYLLPDLGRGYGRPSADCVQRSWRGKLVLGGYDQSIRLSAYAGRTGYDISPPSTLVIASLVNLDALDRSSTLGRVVSEQVSATFTKTGYRMRELKLAGNVFVRKQGELILTREVRELARIHDAQAVVAGTYAVSREYLYVNLKVIKPEGNLVLAAHDYVLPMDRNIRRMLWSHEGYGR